MAKILIVDDDPDIVAITGLHLKNAGYEIATAGSKEDCMKAIKAEKPDLLVLDVMMESEDDGITIAQELKKSGEKFPIIMMTNVGNISGLDFGKDSEMVPVDEFMQKPVDPEELIKTVKELL